MVVIIALIVVCVALLVASWGDNPLHFIGGAEDSIRRGIVKGDHCALIVQYSPTVGAVEDNIKRVEYLLDNDTHSAELIILPECGITGYEFKTRADAELVADGADCNGPTGRYCRELAKRYTAYVACGFPELNDGKLYNSMMIISPTGELISVYRKWNLWPIERVWDATEGDGPGHVDLPGIGRCALAICNDMNPVDYADIAKPESKRLAQYALDNDCKYIIFIAAIPRSKNPSPNRMIQHWELRLSPLLDKDIKLLACSRTGAEYQGQSAVIDFATRTCIGLDRDTDAVLCSKF